MRVHRRSFFQLAGLGALSSVVPKTSHSEVGINAIVDKTSYMRRVTSALKQQWPNNRLINIVCHGHSVPAGFFKTPVVNTFNAYPHLLHRSIKSVYPYCVSNVIVTAIGGENSQSGAARFESQVLCHRPDVVTIDYALNDRGIGLAAARKAWVSMIEKAKTVRGLSIILLTPTPDTAHKPDDTNEPINQHAAQIRLLAEEYEVGLVDSLAGFDLIQKETGDVSALLSQINHPNRKGHDIVAKELFSWFSDEPYQAGIDDWDVH